MYKYIFKRPVALKNKNLAFILQIVKRYEELGGKIYYRSYVQQIVDTKDKKKLF